MMRMILEGGGVRTVPVLLVFFPHLSQSLSPANNLQQMETGLLVGVAFTLHIGRRSCFALWL